MRRIIPLFTAYFAENEQIHPFIKGLAGFQMGRREDHIAAFYRKA